MSTTLATEKQAEAIKQRMVEIRTELPYNADDARVRVKQLADWKYHVSKHPLPILAATAVVGYLLVPAKKTPERIVVERHSQQQVPTAPAKRGMVGGIIGMVATIAMKQASGYAAKELTNFLSKRETT